MLATTTLASTGSAQESLGQRPPRSFHTMIGARAVAALGWALLTLGSCTPRVPPFVELLNTGLRVRSGTVVDVMVKASDVFRDSVSIRVDWGNGDTSAWSVFVPSQETVHIARVWPDSGHFVVRVQARSPVGQVSDWMDGTPVVVLDSSLVRWMVPLCGIERRSATAVGLDGTILVNSWSGLKALRPDGTELWTTDGDFGPPVIDDVGTAFVCSRDYRLRAIGPDGTLKWTDPGWTLLTSIALGADGTLYYARYDTALAMTRDWVEKWRATLPGKAVYSPAVAGDGTVCFISDNDNAVSAFRPDGALRWSTELSAEAVIVGPDDCFYFLNRDGLVALDSGGSPRWEYHLYSDAPYMIVTQDSSVCLVRRIDDEPEHSFYRFLDPLGTSRDDGWWAGDWISTPAAVSGNSVVFTVGATAFCGPLGHDPRSPWSVETGREVTCPITVGPDGTAYVLSDDGLLYAIRTGMEPASSSWPQYLCDGRHTSCAALAPKEAQHD